MISGAKLQFNLLHCEYDQPDVQKEFLARRVRKVKDTTKKKKAEIVDPGQTDITGSSAPYIVNTKKQYDDKTFSNGFGVDFYFDGLRYLPDNVTITKVIIKVVNSNLK